MIYTKWYSYWKVVTRWFRVLPNFIIIGAQRSGTTSLYNYMITHPGIRPGIKKEVHFFDMNFHRGIDWYRSFFPLKQMKCFMQETKIQSFISGEASPYYLFHSLVPERVAKTLPKVKLLVLLRNPVDRAYSHYWFAKRKGWEEFSFSEAIGNESKRLAVGYDNDNYQKFSYLARGIYVSQLERWYQFFSKKQILVLQSERFFAEPDKILNQIFQFLNLSDFSSKIIKYQTDNYPRMDSVIRAKLIKYYRPYNRKLYELLGTTFSWDQS